MNNIIESFNRQQVAKIQESRSFKIPDFKAGDTVNVKYKITESGTTRLQTFSGVVVAKSKSKTNYASTFTVRKVSSGIGVERKFPIYSPLLSEIEVVKRGKSRRSKLYYLRFLTGKASKIKEKRDFSALSKDNSVTPEASSE